MRVYFTCNYWLQNSYYTTLRLIRLNFTSITGFKTCLRLMRVYFTRIYSLQYSYYTTLLVIRLYFASLSNILMKKYKVE